VQRLLDDAASLSISTELAEVEAMKKRASSQWRAIVMDGARCAERVSAYTNLPAILHAVNDRDGLDFFLQEYCVMFLSLSSSLSLLLSFSLCFSGH
jgi:hypothetical protein